MSENNDPQTSGIEFNAEFEQALEVMSLGRNVLITGKAGTGKSTLLRYYRDSLRDPPPVIAPTGIAALNIDGSTIHRFFKFGTDISPQAVVDGKYKPGKELVKTFRNLDTLIIDEVSMVRADLFDAIDCVLTKFGPSRGRPFGGIQLVLFGDLYQLSPVVTESEKARWFAVHGYQTEFFFSSHVMQRIKLSKVELQKVYRQTDSTFVELLNDIRADQLTDVGLRKLNSRVEQDFEPNADSPYVVLTTTNKKVDRVNNERLSELNSQEWVVEAEVWGDVEDSDWPSSIERTLRFKVGAKVMMVRNDPLDRWVNGTIGIVRDVQKSDDCLRVQIEKAEGNEVFDASMQTYEIKRLIPSGTGIEREVVGSISQLPFKLAWAITVHKSQGQTLSHVVVDRHAGFFADGHLYVALSRCTSFEGLVLTSSIKPKDLKVSPKVRRFLAQQDGAVSFQEDCNCVFVAIKRTDFGFATTENEKVLEIGLVDVGSDGAKTRLSSLIAPMTDVGASHKHGVLPGQLSLAPKLSEVWPFFARYLQDKLVVSKDLENLVSCLRTHLKSEDVLFPFLGGFCLTDALGEEFVAALAERDPPITGQSTALELAEAYCAISTSCKCDLIGEVFDGASMNSTWARLYSRDLVESVNGPLKPNSLPPSDPALFYADTIARACCNPEYDFAKVIRCLADLRVELALPDSICSEIHQYFVESLSTAAKRDSQIDQSEYDYIYGVCRLLKVSMPEDICVSSVEPFTIQEGMGVCFSGKFVHPASKDQIKKGTLEKIALANGMVPEGSVTKSRCKLVVVLDGTSMSSKAKNARKYGIPVVTMEAFLDKLGVEIP